MLRDIRKKNREYKNINLKELYFPIFILSISGFDGLDAFYTVQPLPALLMFMGCFHHQDHFLLGIKMPSRTIVIFSLFLSGCNLSSIRLKMLSKSLCELVQVCHVNIIFWGWPIYYLSSPTQRTFHPGNSTCFRVVFWSFELLFSYYFAHFVYFFLNLKY